MWTTTLALKQMEKLLNLTLKLDPFIFDDIAELAGKSLVIHATATPLHFVVVFSEDKIFLNPFDGATHTCHLEAPPLTLMMLCLTKQTTLLHSPLVKLQGDTTVLSSIMQLMNKLDFDWEEHLSKFTGDIFAHLICEKTKAIKEHSSRCNQTLTLNISEYLQEEAKLVPPRLAMDEYLAEIDTLRLDIDRLEARIDRLDRAGKS